MNILKTLGLGVAMTFSVGAFAQEQSTTAASNPSARPIPESDMMYRKTVWRTIDLREKQNKPLFADGRQITKIIIDAVKRGELPIYKNDSLTTTLTQQEFTSNMTMVVLMNQLLMMAGAMCQAQMLQLRRLRFQTNIFRRTFTS